MIKAVVFDLGRVLINIDFSKGVLGLEHIGITDLETILKLAEDQDFVGYSTGKLTPEAFYTKIVERLEVELDYSEFVHLWCNIFTEMTGMKELVTALAKKYPVGLLSDTDPLHWQYIVENYPWIGSVFNNPVLSFQVGAMKPDFKVFEKVVNSVEVEAGECLFIDDLQKNVLGAREYGMQAILFEGKKQLIAELSALGLDI